jgi:hypothetical protein
MTSREMENLTICRCESTFFYEKWFAQTSDSLQADVKIVLGSFYEE